MPTKKSTITKSTIKKFERQQNLPVTSEYLDEERGISWIPTMGILLGDWLKMIHNYYEDRQRKYIFTTNDWGMPCIWFDADTIEELHERQSKEREEAKKENKVDFLNPRIRKPN